MIKLEGCKHSFYVHSIQLKYKSTRNAMNSKFYTKILIPES